MKKLTILALAALFCCMTSCEKNDSGSSSTEIINLFDEIIGLSSEDAHQVVKKRGFKLEDSEHEIDSKEGIDRYTYWYDKNGYMFQFSANKEDIVSMASFGNLGTSSRSEAEKAVSAWLTQLGETYTTRLGHRCKFSYIDPEDDYSLRSYNYYDWEKLLKNVTERFFVIYEKGVVKCSIIAGSEEKDWDVYYITMADTSWGDDW